MTQTFFMYGDGILLMIVILGLFLGCISAINDVKIVSNNLKLENTMLLIYSLFTIQIGMVLSIIIMPAVMMLLNVNWFSTFICATLSLTIYIILLTKYKNLQSDILKIKENRTKEDRQHYTNNKLINQYYYVASLIFLVIESVIGYNLYKVYFAIDTMGSTYGYDLLVFLIIIATSTLLIEYTRFVVKSVANFEKEEKEHLKNLPEIDLEKLKDCKIDTDIKKKK